MWAAHLFSRHKIQELEHLPSTHFATFTKGQEESHRLSQHSNTQRAYSIGAGLVSIQHYN